MTRPVSATLMVVIEDEEVEVEVRGEYLDATRDDFAEVDLGEAEIVHDGRLTGTIVELTGHDEVMAYDALFEAGGGDGGLCD